MKRYSSKSKPIQKGLTLLGVYPLPFRHCQIRNFTSRSYAECLRTPGRLVISIGSFLLAILLILSTSNFSALAASYDGQAFKDSLEKNTEAPTEKQAPAWQAFGLKEQPLDIIGLFAFSKDNSEFLAVSESGKVSVWNLKTAKERVIFPASETINASAYEPNLKVLALSYETQVSLFDLNRASRLAISPRFGTKTSALDFAPDGKSLLVGGEDGKVYRWKLSTPQDLDETKKIEVERYIGHSAPVTALAFHPFNRMFFSADSFGSVAAWLTYDKDLFAGKYDERPNQTTFYADDAPRALTANAENTTILSLKVSRDGQNIFSALQDGRIEWRLVRGLKLLIVAQTNKGAIYDMQLSPSGNRLATVARDGMVRVWETVLLEKAGEVPGGKQNISVVNDFKKDSLGYLKPLKEFALADARKLLFISESKLIVGETSGRLLELSL